MKVLNEIFFPYSLDYQFITEIYVDAKKPPDEEILGRCLNKGISVLFEVGLAVWPKKAFWFPSIEALQKKRLKVNI